MSKKKSRQNMKQAAVSPAAFSCIKTERFIRPATENHRIFKNSILHNNITFCIGPAGTGKTTLAAQTACHLINNTSNDFNRIIYIRSNVPTKDEQSIGALKGDFEEKVAPLAKPLIDALLNIMSYSEIKSLFEFSKIETETLTYLRGRSFRNAIVIADEIENFTLHAFRTILTRFESSSKMVLLGDPEQSDLFYKSNKSDLCRRVAMSLNDLPDVKSIFFNDHDIVRNPMISSILAALRSVDNID